MINGERVCFYLTEHAKTNSEANFRMLALGELYTLLSNCVQEIKSNPHVSPYLKRAYGLASETTSRISNGMKLKEQRYD